MRRTRISGTPIPSPTPIPIAFEVVTDWVAVDVGDICAESGGVVLDEVALDMMVVVLMIRLLL